MGFLGHDAPATPGEEEPPGSGRWGSMAGPQAPTSLPSRWVEREPWSAERAGVAPSGAPFILLPNRSFAQS